MKAWTDYPFVSLGDIAGEEAPVRECKVVAYDKNKYCKVIVDGKFEEVKSGYLYAQAGRLDEVPCVDRDKLELLPAEYAEN